MRLRVLAAALVVAPIASGAVAGPAIEVAKTSGCGCCRAWIEVLEQAGFEVTARDLWPAEIIRLKLDHGIGQGLQSCHTGLVEGYAIEGHVPVAEIERLLAERPDAVGLSVPGMPVGSPGMEMGDRQDPYDVLLIGRDGTTEVFASYPAR